MNDSNKLKEGILIGLIVGASIASALLSPNRTERDFRREAIRHGAAKWEATTNGDAQFVWNSTNDILEKK